MVRQNGRARCPLSDAERRKIVDDLEDGPLQYLTAVCVLIAASRTMVDKGRASKIDATLRRMGIALDQGIDQLRAIIVDVDGGRHRLLPPRERGYDQQLAQPPRSGLLAASRDGTERRSRTRAPVAV